MKSEKFEREVRAAMYIRTFNNTHQNMCTTTAAQGQSRRKGEAPHAQRGAAASELLTIGAHDPRPARFCMAIVADARQTRR